MEDMAAINLQVNKALKGWQRLINKMAKQFVNRRQLPFLLWEDYSQVALTKVYKMMLTMALKEQEVGEALVVDVAYKGMKSFYGGAGHLTPIRPIRTGNKITSFPKVMYYQDEDRHPGFQLFVEKSEGAEVKDLLKVFTVLIFQNYPLESSATLLFSDAHNWYHPITKRFAAEAKAIADLECVDSWISKNVKDERTLKALVEIEKWEPEILVEGPRRGLSNEDREKIRELWLSGKYTQKSIAESFGCSQSAVFFALQNDRKEGNDLPAWIRECVSKNELVLSTSELAEKYHSTKSTMKLCVKAQKRPVGRKSKHHKVVNS